MYTDKPIRRICSKVVVMKQGEYDEHACARQTQSFPSAKIVRVDRPHRSLHCKRNATVQYVAVDGSVTVLQLIMCSGHLTSGISLWPNA